MKAHNISIWLMWGLVALLATQLFTSQQALTSTRTLSHQLDSLHFLSDRLVRLHTDYEAVSHDLHTTRAQAAALQQALHALSTERITTVARLQQQLQLLLSQQDSLSLPILSYSSTDSLLFEP